MLTKDEWERILVTEFSEHVDIHGHTIYPIKTQEQWLLYNDYCLGMVKEEEEIKRDYLAEEEIRDLCEFWKFSKEQTKKDKTYLCIYNVKGVYKLIAYYRDKIKEVGTIKGEIKECVD